MRITESNTPILRYLTWKKELTEHKDFRKGLKILGAYDCDVDTYAGRGRYKDMATSFSKRWPTYQKWFSKNITVVSAEFFNQAWENINKIVSPETCKELIENPISGTLIVGHLSICYWLRSIDGNRFEGDVLAHQSGITVFALNGECKFITKAVIEQPALRSYTQKEIEERGNELEETVPMAPILIHLFKKYAPVEVVDAYPFRKVRIPNTENETLLVDSNLKVQYLDCSWFRTIVRKEGFLVSGHFRLQPYKNEKKEWDKKLIYIEPYQKHGYTRTAKKIIAERKENE